MGLCYTVISSGAAPTVLFYKKMPLKTESIVNRFHLNAEELVKIYGLGEPHEEIKQEKEETVEE